MDKIIIYGAGQMGKRGYDFLKFSGLEKKVYGFTDKKYQEMESIDGKKIYSYHDAISFNLPFYILIGDEREREKIKRKLLDDGMICYGEEDMWRLFDDRVQYNRCFVAYDHIDGYEDYFEIIEEQSALDIFWEKDKSKFYELFQRLDLDNVIELACGRGRHVPQYLDQAGKITLVDILQKNIDYCMKRFRNYNNIFYYCNDGYNLEKLSTGEYSALFCYDSMVHFEMMDIYEYLKDIYRVLKSGGRALLHHSNHDKDYKIEYSHSPGGRNFMNKKIFAYLSNRVGFEVEEQIVIDWVEKDLDCITLLRKS